MGKYAKSYFENPYLEQIDEETKYSADVIMDEARQKWRAGGWRARAEDFEFDPEKLTDESEEETQTDAENENADGARHDSDRFSLDIKRDLTGETISRKALQELDYSSSYRPKGELEERVTGRRSTLQRYDILAGELEAPPDNLDFVSDAKARRERERKRGELRTGKLRRDSRRLESSIEERRSELMHMLPKEEDRSRQIVAETERRKERENAEKGRKVVKKTKKRFSLPETNIELPDGITVSRLERLPEQCGMSESTMELPEFTTEARYWSKIEGTNPTWSQVAEHSVYTVPKEEETPDPVGTRYVKPEDGDRSEYGLTKSRARVRSEEAGQFNNEYIREENIDPERIKQIMGHHYRGRWIPPEFFADNRLVEDYFNALSSGQTNGEDFVTWAYMHKMAQQRRKTAEEQARRQYIHAVRSARGVRRGAQPRSLAQLRDDARRQQYEEARQRGFRQGEELKRASEKQPPQPTSGYPPYGYDPYGGYGAFAAGQYYPPQYGGAQYRGMYPELFEGRASRPQRPPQRRAGMPVEYRPPYSDNNEDK